VETEFRLLLATSKISLSPAELAEITVLVDRPVDWERFFHLAWFHRTFPLAYQNLAIVVRNAAIVPTELLQKLRKISLESAQKNIFLTGELQQIVSSFKSQGRKILVYKGALAAIELYDNLALRPFGDIDILVPPIDRNAAIELLLELGYQKASDRPLLHYDYELTFVHPQRRTVVDLHWHITSPAFPINLTFEELWQRRRTTEIGKEEISCFSREDLFIILCIHASKHGWLQLSWLVDLGAFINLEIDWEVVAQRSQKWHVSQIVALGICLANELLDAGLPLPERRRRSAALTLVKPFIQEITAASDTPADRVSSLKLQFQTRERWQDRLIMMANLFITNDDNIGDITLPRFWHFLYYPIAALRRLKKYCIPDPLATTKTQKNQIQ
jgi:hypothetical protein